MEIVKGIVDHIVYRNAENAYTVLILHVGEDELTCVGFFQDVDAGECLEIQGEYTDHAVYGHQLKAKSYKVVPPDDAISMERYLGSGAIKGIGAVLAGRIVKKFGADTFRIMEQEPERLVEIPGISERKAREIAAQMEDKKDLRDAMMYLQQFGINGNLAVKIYQTYGIGLYKVMEENPYKLAEDIIGVGFKTADEIASKIGIHTDADYRIRSGILYTLLLSSGEGHMYLPEEILISRAAQLLGLEPEQLTGQIENLMMDQKIIVKQACQRQPNHGGSAPQAASGEKDIHAMWTAAALKPDDKNGTQASAALEQNGENATQTSSPSRDIYAHHFYYAELNCARMLTDLNEAISSSSLYFYDQSDWENKNASSGKIGHHEEKELKRIRKIEKELQIELDELQRKAVFESQEHGVFILSGGPGTGKTTTINTMIRYFEEEGCDILLAAPTGRAAKRMTEATGYEARTIHRMLELSGAVMDEGVNGSARGGARFERNAENPLEADVIIVDEMSMVDVFLMQSLLKAIVPGTRLVMVGDMDQLPSVGPGQVLRDLIRSKSFPTVILQKIYRQAGESDIVYNAHRINRGETIALDNQSKDFFFLSRNDVNVIYKHMVLLIRDKLPGYVQADPMEIQVLTPMRKGPLGVETLNQILQQYLNPEAPEKRQHQVSESRIFREGDKVMQIKNNYQLEWEIVSKYNIPIDTGTGIFNGDMGVIKEINEFDSSLVVEYDEHRLVTYPFSGLDELELAYAVTIHKSQGSEYPAVILPLLAGPRMLMNRNLLYTAVTRAKGCVTILGSADTVYEMIQNISENMRYSSLDIRLKEIQEAQQLQAPF